MNRLIITVLLLFFSFTIGAQSHTFYRNKERTYEYSEWSRWIRSFFKVEVTHLEDEVCIISVFTRDRSQPSLKVKVTFDESTDSGHYYNIVETKDDRIDLIRSSILLSEMATGREGIISIFYRDGSGIGYHCSN